MNIFEILFTRPILNLLVFIYNNIPGNDFGLSIIVLTVVIKFILFPLSVKSIKSQKALQDLQPKMNALKEKYKDNKEALGREMMDLYKKEKVSPFSSCLPLLLQFPFLIAIYQVLRNGMANGAMEKLYYFIPAPETVSTMFLGFLDLSQKNVALAVIAGALQFLQTKMLTRTKQPNVPGSKDESMTSALNKQMMYMMPIVTIVIGVSLPGGLMLYWGTSTLVTILQQVIVFKKNNPDQGNKLEQQSLQ